MTSKAAKHNHTHGCVVCQLVYHILPLGSRQVIDVVTFDALNNLLVLAAAAAESV